MACSLDVHFPTSISTAGTDAVWAEEDREGPPPDGLPFDPIDSLWYCVRGEPGECEECNVYGFAIYQDAAGDTVIKGHPNDPHLPDTNWHGL